MPSPRSARFWLGCTAVVSLGAAGFGVGRYFSGPGGAARDALLADLNAFPMASVLAADFGSATGLPDIDPENVVLAQRKRIMGRMRSLEMIRRVTRNVRPILERAIEQPSIQEELRSLAASAGMSLEQYKTYFKGKQEADLLLESGGDPNARSVSNAIGLAQYLAGTARQCGLRVDLGRSNALSRDISRRSAGWSGSRRSPPTGSGRSPALRGVVPTLPAAPAAPEDASAVPVPGAAGAKPADGVWSRNQWLAYRRSQWQELVRKRRQVDHRFDPERAVMAQTRYLVKLTRRYAGVDWALQAYHGGEEGAAKTMRLFADSGAYTQLASRGPYTGRGGTSYSDLYCRISPTAAPAAFSYLFGRSDDHRYYWWKVLMAERALDLYRKDPADFERQWQALQPGLSSDAAWYPDPSPLQFQDEAALREAYRSGELVRLPSNAAAFGIRTENIAVLQPEAAPLHKGLRPEAMGALLKIAHIYRSHSGAAPITALALVQSNDYRALWDARYPDPPLPPSVPGDPEFHSTGATFDLQRPQRDWDRKVLEFALGRLYDGLRISWRPEREAGSRRYHVVVNPQFKAELAEYYRKVAR